MEYEIGSPWVELFVILLMVWILCLVIRIFNVKQVQIKGGSKK